MKNAKKTLFSKDENEYGYFSVFPTQLRNLLAAPGMTQDKLAKVVGVTRQAVSNWRNGATAPDIIYLTKIADFFGVSYEYLLDGIEAPKKKHSYISRETGLSSDTIDALDQAFFLYRDSGMESNLIKAMNLLFTRCDETAMLLDIPDTSFLNYLSDYFFTTTEEYEQALSEGGMLKIDSAHGFASITAIELEEIMLRRIEARLRYLRTVAQDKIAVEKLEKEEHEKRVRAIDLVELEKLLEKEECDKHMNAIDD